MITEDQIRFLLSDIENERVERTTSTDDTDKFAKAVCAFANDLSNKRLPGYLLIGAFDNGKLNGLKVTDRLLRNLAGLRSDGNIQPKPALMVGKVSFPEGDIAVVEVQPSKNTPVKYKSTIYVRIGARKSEANEEEERILREKSEVKAPTFDTTPCLHSTLDDLDMRLFKTEYLPKFVKATVLKSDKRTVKQQLAPLKLFDLAFDCPTVAGILLIGKDPKHILFGSYIQYVQFAGKSRTSKVLNERQFSGNLLTMLKDLDYFIKYTIQKQRPVFVTVLREEMRINYPYEAIRELAMNLVMHRNYQTNAPAKFYEYSDRIEMDNPGNLYGKVHADNFPDENDYRNPVIADAMKIFGYVNRFGRGISMVQEELETNNNGLAVFNFSDITTFKVTVMNAENHPIAANSDVGVNVGEENSKQRTHLQDNTKNHPIAANSDVGVNVGVNVGEENSKQHTHLQDNTKNHPIAANSGVGVNVGVKSEIIKHIETKPNVSAKELAVLLKKTARTIERQLKELREQGVIERIGSDKNGYWKIKE
jgi:ATP-dependent DNA helicase RecG